MISLAHLDDSARRPIEAQLQQSRDSRPAEIPMLVDNGIFRMRMMVCARVFTVLIFPVIIAYMKIDPSMSHAEGQASVHQPLNIGGKHPLPFSCKQIITKKPTIFS